MEKLSKKAHYCASCEFWEGERQAAPDMDNVIYHSFQRSLCRGGGKNGEKTTPLMRCISWRMWKKMAKKRQSVLVARTEEEDAIRQQEEEAQSLLKSLDDLDKSKV